VNCDDAVSLTSVNCDDAVSLTSHRIARGDEARRGIARAPSSTRSPSSPHPQHPITPFSSLVTAIIIIIVIAFSSPATRRRSRITFRPVPSRPRRREKITASAISCPIVATRLTRHRTTPTPVDESRARLDAPCETRRVARPPSTATSVDAHRGTVRCPRAPTTEAIRARRWTTRPRP